ncbi:RimK/LysX family protein [Photobacterium lipolyticum]|uniref:Retropepsin-like aspartic endopeptidase domain-containing protein n=1 Tax=Photobacterium lipolyticum TaxID=266810 RepID=A0A2T3MZL3_9GAMM|nr:RimK/LysX family protein [Photobacterium lipolyticum]PSW05389.1 hypothetical protein C9I89_09010 [Photobacterium lipolyticum]
MKRITVGFCALLLFGCAQQQGTEEPETKPDVGQEVEIKPVEPTVQVTTVPEVKTESKPELKPEVKQEPQPEVKPKPKPVVTKTSDGKLILGAEEWVWLVSVKKHVKVKIDTESKLSTIGVSDVQEFERDSKDWVKFTASGKSLEMPVERWIKNNGGERQAVVKLRIKLGELNELTEFVLKNGTGIVLGENFIRDVAVFDGKRKYIQPKVK